MLSTRSRTPRRKWIVTSRTHSQTSTGHSRHAVSCVVYSRDLSPTSLSAAVLNVFHVSRIAIVVEVTSTWPSGGRGRVLNVSKVDRQCMKTSVC